MKQQREYELIARALLFSRAEALPLPAALTRLAELYDRTAAGHAPSEHTEYLRAGAEIARRLAFEIDDPLTAEPPAPADERSHQP